MVICLTKGKFSGHALEKILETQCCCGNKVHENDLCHTLRCFFIKVSISPRNPILAKKRMF